MTDKKFKYNIMDVLGRLSRKKRDFSKEEEKALVPLVTMRWLTGTKSERQVFLINNFANKYCFSLSHHKELLINLMTVATSGRASKYQWMKREAKTAPTKLSDRVVAEYYRYSRRHAHEAANMLDNDTILSHAEELGYQNDQLKELRKELKLR